MNKSFYRTSLNDCKKYIKLGLFADEVGISRSALTMFLKSEEFDYQISLEKLDLLYNTVKNYCNNI